MGKKIRISALFLFALLLTVKASDKAESEKKPIGIEIFLTINRSREHDRIENSGLYRYNLRTEKLTEIYDGSQYGLGNSIGSDVGGGGRAKVTFDKDGVRFVTTAVDYAPLIHVAYKDGKITFLTSIE